MVDPGIELIVKKYLNLLAESGIRVDRAFLYGSCARGGSLDSSDIDLMLVSDIFDTDDDMVLSKPWLYTVKVDHRIEPVSVGSRRFDNDSESPLIGIVKKEGIQISLTPQ
jgi:predicted nucleotidyltransferase